MIKILTLTWLRLVDMIKISWHELTLVDMIKISWYDY